MECRSGCGACCVAPSISSEIPGLPGGKPANTKCIHLQEDLRCGIYEQRPKVCRDFKAEKDFCGSSREEALEILARLEKETKQTGIKP